MTKKKGTTMFVYHDAIEDYYRSIRRTLYELGDEVSQIFSKRGFPAHPALDDDDSTASLVRWAIDYLDMHKAEISHSEWQTCIDIYGSIPKRHSSMVKGDKQHSGEMEVYLKLHSLDAGQRIADYIAAQGINVPRLTRAGKPNHKVIAGLAIIYMGRVLEEK